MPTITIDGTDYDVNKDFTWQELIEVEKLSGLPLGRDGSLDSLAVIAGFFFIVKRRVSPGLTWEAFTAEPMPAQNEPDETADGASKPKAKAKPRPT